MYIQNKITDIENKLLVTKGKREGRKYRFEICHSKGAKYRFVL